MLANKIIIPTTIKARNKMLVAVKGARIKYEDQWKEAEKYEEVTVNEKNLKTILNEIS